MLDSDGQPFTSEPIDPPELWMLRFKNDRCFVRACDGFPEALCLVCFSEADAIKAAQYQNDNYLDDDNPCHPVRVK